MMSNARNETAERTSRISTSDDDDDDEPGDSQCSVSEGIRKNRLPLRRLSTGERIELARESYYVNVDIADRPAHYFMKSAPVMNDAIIKLAYKRVYEDRLLLTLYETDPEFRAAVDAGEISSSAAKERARQMRRSSESFQPKKSRAVAAKQSRLSRKRFRKDGPTRGLQHDIDSFYSTIGN